MLARENRLTSSRAFAATIRRGRRAGTRTMVLHLELPSEARSAGSATAAPPDDAGARAARVGFVVSKAVGNAVRRNRVQRRLRHLARERLTSLPGTAVLVVRALPSAASASTEELAGDFDRALRRVLRRRTVGGAPGAPS